MELHETTQTSYKFDSGSFKDPDGRVAYWGGRVVRLFSETGAQRFQTIVNDKRIELLSQKNLLIPYTILNDDEEKFDCHPYSDFVLEHPYIPLLSYPYEWSFSMLKDAALLTLQLQYECLKLGLTLKDATPYNVACYEGRMMFIDLPSIVELEEGQTWQAYGQFCRELLFPLLLTAHKNIDFRIWLRGSLKGVELTQIAGLFPLSTWLRKGIFRHVVLQSMLERHSRSQNFADLKKGNGEIRVPLQSILKLVESLQEVVQSLTVQDKASRWIDYAEVNSYQEHERVTKDNFLGSVFSEDTGGCLVDLGCNTGAYSLKFASKFSFVVGVDSDQSCIDKLYREVKAQGLRNYYPLVNDLLNPSPAIGWQLQERKSLLDRIKPDAFIALALIHHICIAGNVPLAMFVSFLTQFGRYGVLEWVDRKDAMVEAMIASRGASFEDYTWDNFLHLIKPHFIIKNLVETHNGNRKLLHLIKEGSFQD